MSEFLHNLAARGLGITQPLRPRVPSRFEPVPGISGLLAGRTSPSEEHFDHDLEPQNAADALASSATPLRGRATVKPSSTVGQLQQSHDQSQTGRTLTEPFHPAAPRPHTADATAYGESATIPIGQTSRAETLSQTGTTRTWQHATDATSPHPIAPLAVPERSPATNEPRQRPHLQQNQSPTIPAHTADLLPEARQSQLATSSSRLDALPRKPARRVAPNPGASTTASAEPLVPSHSLSPDAAITAIAPRTTSTSTTPAELIPAAAHASAAAPAPAPHLAPAAPSEPSIRVTIGRVDVRAILTDQPVKPPPPARFKPSVSLDDYLRRGSSGARP